MLYGRHTRKTLENFPAPIYGDAVSGKDIPKYKMPKEPIEDRVAYRLIKDELIDEGNARQNLATFCQTFMENKAANLMRETLEKNAIDKTEYSETSELENRCVNMIAELWHAPAKNKFIGTATIGSSEACMLAGLAMKFRWRNRASRCGIDVTKRKPNIVISAGYQVCWEKFCVYFDVELRTVPLTKKCMRMDSKKMTEYFDDYTIGVVGILGQTYTGYYDDIAEMDRVISEYNKRATVKLRIHVDAASGGFYAPFVDKKLRWDFLLSNVISINASGHKYGLVYPGVGWILWRDERYLDDELIFKVNYLGGEIPTIALNFSKSAAHIIGQYYNFMRLGVSGFTAIHKRSRDVAKFLAKSLKETGFFEILNDGGDLPVVCYALKENKKVNWSLYDFSDRLKMKGWLIPTYPMPENVKDVLVQRIVVRSDFAMNLAHDFANDIFEAIKVLNSARIVSKAAPESRVSGFTH